MVGVLWLSKSPYLSRALVGARGVLVMGDSCWEMSLAREER